MYVSCKISIIFHANHTNSILNIDQYLVIWETVYAVVMQYISN